MTKEEFREIRQGLGLSLSDITRGLRLKSTKDNRAVRYYESGEREISGPVARHMIEFRDGKPI